MPKCIIMHELAVMEGSKDPKDIMLTFEEQYLDSQNPLTDGIKVQDLVSFYERTVNETDMIKGNFYMEKAVPRLFKGKLIPKSLSPDDFRSYLQTKPESPEMTVIEIMRTLSDFGSKIKFEERFYNKMTGGVVFDNFIPNFDTARISADNLIISGRKFNIVLTGTIDGLVDMDGIHQVFSRFHPFKLVKYGELVHDSIQVLIDDKNKSFLQSINVNVNGEWATIPLTEFPIFHTKGATPSLESVYELLDRIQSHKSIDKAYKFYLEQLKENMPSSELPTKEWFRGEPVDDDYISDEGTEFFDTWIKGLKGIISVEKLLTELPDLGDSYYQLFPLFAKLDEVGEKDLNHFSNIFESLETIIEAYEKKRLLKKYESIILRSMKELLKLQGTRLVRYKELIRKIKENSKHLNALELKLLNHRWNLYRNSPNDNLALNNYLMNLGEYEGQRKGTLDLSNFSDHTKVIVFKKGIVEKLDKGINFNSNFDGVTPIISTDIEGV